MVAGVFLTVNASGAAEAARMGHVVVIVDVIDMSTTAEAALDAGAFAIFGASPDHAKPPVLINPLKVAEAAGNMALLKKAKVVIIAEPRVGADQERCKTAQGVIAGLKRAGVKVNAVLPNLGAETPKLFNLKDCIIILATGTGGVAFDAAFTAGAAAVLTATVARTLKKKGAAPARAGVERAVKKATELKTGITVVAASGNSLEDILAAEYIVKSILNKGFN